MNSKKRQTIVHSVFFFFFDKHPKIKGRTWPLDGELAGRLIPFAGRLIEV